MVCPPTYRPIMKQLARISGRTNEERHCSTVTRCITIRSSEGDAVRRARNNFDRKRVVIMSRLPSTIAPPRFSLRTPPNEKDLLFAGAIHLVELRQADYTLQGDRRSSTNRRSCFHSLLVVSTSKGYSEE